MERLVSPKGMILIQKFDRAHQNSLAVSIPTPGSEADAVVTDRTMRDFPSQQVDIRANAKCESDEAALWAKIPGFRSCEYDSDCGDYEVPGRLL